MKNLILLLVGGLLAQSALADTVALGKVEFFVDTNVKMFKFKGTAGELQSKLVHTGPQLTHVELSIPVQSLKTGMDLRDRHMRERIFTTADGKSPDVLFTADSAQCSAQCEVTGNLTIRGETRPQKLLLTMKDPTHVEGTAKIALSTFGIEAPSQAGIKVADVVDVNFAVELK
jgi:polyisoprenoid-binding protein YceI